MEKEDYVSLEVAKLLKEKGFDEPCCMMYNEYEESYEFSCYTIITKKGFKNSNECDYNVTVPTLYEAQKWLRINHRILITPTYLFNDKYTYHILRMDAGNIYCHNYNQYDSYEETLNAGIYDALNLI